MVFQGASALNLDAKGCMSLPAKHRDALLVQGKGRITLTKHHDGCLLLFSRPEWETFRARVAQLPMDAHWWRRIFLGNAVEIDLDSAGRILVSPELRAAAGIEKKSDFAWYEQSLGVVECSKRAGCHSARHA